MRWSRSNVYVPCFESGVYKVEKNPQNSPQDPSCLVVDIDLRFLGRRHDPGLSCDGVDVGSGAVRGSKLVAVIRQ